LNGLRSTPVTFAIAGLCVAVFVLTMTMSPSEAGALLSRFELTPAQLTGGGFRSGADAAAALIGHAFLHAGIFHLLMNMIVFFQAAPFLEQRMGSLRFAALYLVSILGGAAGYILINPDSTQAMVGASGAVCGVFAGFFLAVRPTPRAALADPRVRNAMLTFVGVNVVLVALLPLPIAWEAHLGGFVTGAIAYLLLKPSVPAGPWT